LGALLILSEVLFFFAKNESLPTGEKGKEADALATKMLKKMNIDAYNTTEIIEWSFRNEHHYKWFKSKKWSVYFYIIYFSVYKLLIL
jgi:hypothetical protein